MNIFLGVPEEIQFIFSLFTIECGMDRLNGHSCEAYPAIVRPREYHFLFDV